MSMRAFIILALLLSVTLQSAPSQASEPRRVYQVAVAPQQPPLAMHTLWRPLLDQLEKELGVSFQLKLSNNFTEFEDLLGIVGPDLIYATPALLVQVHKKSGYTPLVRAAKPISAVLLVRKDSGIKSVQELSGQQISFVGSRNICSLFIQHTISTVEPPLQFKQAYVGSTSNVLKSVQLNKTMAGAVLLSSLEREPETIKAQFRVLMETPRIAAHPLAANPRVPKAFQEQLTTAMLKLAATPSGNELLKKVGLGEPVRADYARDYKALESIDYETLTKGK